MFKRTRTRLRQRTVWTVFISSVSGLPSSSEFDDGRVITMNGQAPWRHATNAGTSQSSVRDQELGSSAVPDAQNVV